MENKDQTPLTDASANPDKGTAKADQTAKSGGEPTGEKKVQEPTPGIDYETKFKASQEEAIRLRKALEAKEEQWSKIDPVLQTLNDNPELMQAVDEAYTRTTSGLPSETQTKIIEALVEKKVKERLMPVQEEIELDRRSRVEKAFADFTKKHPDALANWAQIERNLKGMKASGYPLEEGLENAYFLAKKDEAVRQGKKEMAFEIFQQQQASAGGGASASSGSGDDSALTAEEEKVARELGLKSEDYAASKLTNEE